MSGLFRFIEERPAALLLEHMTERGGWWLLSDASNKDFWACNFAENLEYKISDLGEIIEAKTPEDETLLGNMILFIQCQPVGFPQRFTGQIWIEYTRAALRCPMEYMVGAFGSQVAELVDYEQLQPEQVLAWLCFTEQVDDAPPDIFDVEFVWKLNYLEYRTCFDKAARSGVKKIIHDIKNGREI